MIAIIVGGCTEDTTCSDFDFDSSDVYSADSYYDIDYEPAYEQEIKSVEFQWHVPRKINLPKLELKHKVRIQVRNQLPRKMRKNEI